MTIYTFHHQTLSSTRDQDAQGRSEIQQDQDPGRQEEEGFVNTPPPGRDTQLTVTDPNAPKRGLSAYMFFANEQRENVREENPGISFGKLSFLHPHTSAWHIPY